jgi:hypothetical protein
MKGLGKYFGNRLFDPSTSAIGRLLIRLDRWLEKFPRASHYLAHLNVVVVKRTVDPE